MKCRAAVIFCLPFLLPLPATGANKSGFTVAVKYEGGSLPLNQGKTKATISGEDVVFSRGARKVVIPLKNITAVSCSAEVRRRFGASVLRAVPHMHLGTVERDYIGLTWAEGEPASPTDAILKLSNSDYRDVLARLERLTGRKAVNTLEVPTVVKYGL